jgi:hypothetical protein
MDEDAPKLGVAFDGVFLRLEPEVFGILVEVLLTAAEVDDEDLVLLLGESNQEVIGVDVVVDQALGVHPLNTFEHLVGDDEDGLEREAALAVPQQLLQRRPVDVGHQGAEVVLDAVPVEIRHAHSTLHQAVELRFFFEHGLLLVHALQLYRDFLL